MGQPRPKILSRVTVPTGGWQLRVKVSNVGSLDTTVDCTVAAGDYYVSWDNQTDDFIYELSVKLNTALAASAFGSRGALFSINSTGNVIIGFDGAAFQGAPAQDVEITWLDLDGSSIAGVLGFNPGANDQSTGADNPTFTSDSQHAYAWYADSDGLLKSLMVENVSAPSVMQSVSPSGHAKTHLVSEKFRNALSLQHLKRDRTYSQNIGYTVNAVHPYARNRGLECWWKEAIKGVPFRVYRDARIDLDSSSDRGTATGGTATTLTDSGKSWAVGPQEHDNRILYVDGWANDTAQDMRWFIASHTATVITVANQAEPQYNVNNSTAYYIFDQPYETFWLDIAQISEFSPFEIPNIDRYNIDIPLLKFEA